ncbi:hypothetical protein Tco_0697467 [Tanacetum coccineum]
MSNEAVESTPSTPTSEISTTPVGFEMSLPDEISTTTSGLRMRGGGVRMRGAGVRMRTIVVTIVRILHNIKGGMGCYEEPMQLQEPRLNKSKHSCTRSQDCTNCSQAHKSSQDEDFA